MAMLAERRQKPKWSLNPRRTWWTEDSNKFGQKMLERMGWSKGKGLGANEQGITEHIRVRHKNNTNGLGFKTNFNTQIIHESFNDLLKQLQENQDINQKLEDKNDNLSKQSIELKSEQTQSRVRYQKVIRSKDVNKYNSKDLANIFEQKELTPKTQIKIEKENDEEETIGIKDNKHGIVTINGGSMADYFKFKSKHNSMTDYFKCKLNYNKNLSNNMTDSKEIDSDSTESVNEQYIGFGFAPKVENTLPSNCEVSKDFGEKNNYAFDNPCIESNSPAETAFNIDGSSKKLTKKKRKEFESDNLHVSEPNKYNVRKKLKTKIIEGNCVDGFTNPALNLDIKPEKNCNGKEFEVSRAQFGLENSGLDLMDEKNDKKRVTFNDHIMLFEYDTDSIKKKTGKATLDKFEVENKKDKKKRKHESVITSVPNGFVNEALDIEICEEINDNELNEHRSKKMKKRKIRKTSNLETIQESPEREKKITEIGTEQNTNVVENEETDIVDKKSKKKKKKKIAKVEDITVISTISEEPDIEIEDIIRDERIKRDKSKGSEIETSKKHKKKKKKDKQNCKTELVNCTIENEIYNDQQNTKILDKFNSKLQQNNLPIENVNKDAALPDIIIKEEEEEKSIENIKEKKKKNNTNDEDCSKNEINIRDAEKEISDKKNADKEQNSDIKKSAKKDKKHKKSKNKNISDTLNPNIENVDLNTIEQEKIEKTEFTDTSSKISETSNNAIDGIIIDSLQNGKARMSKKLLITLYNNNALVFPGSNIHKKKGYSTDVEC